MMILQVNVKIKALKNELQVDLKNNVAIFKTNLPPEKNKINKKLIEYIAEYFRVPQANVRILRGHKSRHKIVQVIE